MKLLQVGTLLCILLLTDARRVRVRGPVRVAAVEADQVEQPQQQQIVYADDAQNGDAYNGLYGQLERADEQYQRPTARTIAQTNRVTARVKDTPREPPVETIRNYSNINDDGSFTFGYESADGSFKEETRGTDCVVRGKYGYVDPDGNKREFSYVSGNPCDPNAAKDEEEEEQKEAEDSGEENIPQNVGRPIRPQRPLQQARPQAIRPATTVFQNNYNSGSDDEEEQQQVYVQPAPLRPRVQQPARPANVVRVTPRPQVQPTTTLPATTYRPQQFVSVTPRPTTVLQKQPTYQPSPAFGGSSFDEELKRFQVSNAVTTPRAFPSSPAAPKPAGQPLYTSELVFDPRSGQYNTVVYQQVPKSAEGTTLTTRLPQYVASPAPQFVTPTPPQSPPQNLQQSLFQQKNQALFQQSQDLYNQQRLQQQQLQPQQPHRFQSASLGPASTKPLGTAPQRFASPLEVQRPLSLPQLAPQPVRLSSYPQYQPAEPQRPQTQFYFASPTQDVRGVSNGQIDSFLRNFNLSL